MSGQQAWVHRAGLCALLMLCSPSTWASRSTVADTHNALHTATSDRQRAGHAPFIARERFLAQPTVQDVQLSPDGRYISRIERTGDRSNVLVRDLASGRDTRVQADVRQLETAWSGDGQWLWLADRDGLAVYDVRAGAGRRVFTWDPARRQQFFGVDDRASAWAIVSERTQKSGARWYRYLLVDAQGGTRLLYEGAMPLRGALLDSDGALSDFTTYDGADFDTVVRHRDHSGTHEILRCTGAEQCRLVGTDALHDTVFALTTHGSNLLSLKRWRVKAGRWETVAHDPSGVADTSALLWPPGANHWLAVAYHPDRQHWYGADPGSRSALDRLQARLAGANLELASSADGSRWLVTARKATWQFARYYLYAPASGTLRPLFEPEGMNGDVLAAAQPIDYRARDGYLLHGYVYLPAGVDPAHAPVIASVHGGPFNRERDNYDPFVQLLVNRGYVVFEPNFRASTGYGTHYVLDSSGDFGNGRVLHDILDGLDALIGEGIGARDKQAVIGHSFGGYASLLAVTHAPKRFRFAVAGAAPPAFGWGMQWIAANGGSALPEDGPVADVFLDHYGIPLHDRAWSAQMRRDSPLAHVAQLHTPVYLWAGVQDDRVPLTSVVRYAADAHRHGSQIDLLADPDSGHNPGKALNFEAMLWLIEAAADKHFGGGVSPPSAPLATFLDHNLRMDDAALRAQR